MKKFLIIILIALLGLNGYLLNKIALLNSEFEKLDSTIEKLSEINNQSIEIKDINRLMFESNFKDNVVLNHFNLTIGIILGFFTILIGLGVYLSFQRIDEDIKELKTTFSTVKEIKSNIDKAALDIKETKKEFKIQQLTFNATNYTNSKLNLLNSFSSLVHTDSKYRNIITIEHTQKIGFTLFMLKEVITLINNDYDMIHLIYNELTEEDKKGFINYNISHYTEDFGVIIDNLLISFQHNLIRSSFSKDDIIKLQKSIEFYCNYYNNIIRVPKSFIEKLNNFVKELENLNNFLTTNESHATTS
ncbi:hypothetical protein [Myroides odoratus]|uniref:hypothetical protein n=1 Tax=Myroides odoratus TaxID=256 RepID=UPI003342359F